MGTKNFIECNTVAELRAYPDGDLENYSACRLGNPASPDSLQWFLIDRLSTTPDDGNRPVGFSSIACNSGKGRWVIMTPSTYGIIAELNRQEQE